MKKILVILVSALLLSGCYNPGVSNFNGSDKLIVVEIRILPDNQYQCWYEIQASASQWAKSMWFIDDVGKYSIGETVNIKE
jgi:hypothetical protein